MRFFRRRSNGFSPVLLIFGAMGTFMACMMFAIGVPMSFMRAREVSNLPQPAPAVLVDMPAGTTVVISARIPRDTPTIQGLALYKVEEKLTGTPSAEFPESTPEDRQWQWVDGTQSLQMELSDGRFIDVQFPRSVGMQSVEETTTDQVNNGAVERQTKGYLPGQTVAIEGRWEGDDLLTANVVYGGSIDEFVEGTGRAPYQLALFSAICLIFSFAMLGGGAALRFLGR